MGLGLQHSLGQGKCIPLPPSRKLATWTRLLGTGWECKFEQSDARLGNPGWGPGIHPSPGHSWLIRTPTPTFPAPITLSNPLHRSNLVGTYSPVCGGQRSDSANSGQQTRLTVHLWHLESTDSDCTWIQRKRLVISFPFSHVVAQSKLCIFPFRVTRKFEQ